MDLLEFELEFKFFFSLHSLLISIVSEEVSSNSKDKENRSNNNNNSRNKKFKTMDDLPALSQRVNS